MRGALLVLMVVILYLQEDNESQRRKNLAFYL